MIDPDPLPAGSFSSWLRETGLAQEREGGAEVPCGDCTACCTSSQFVHVGPDETETLSRIPRALLFPAPGRPRGHVLLGYDDRGHCPMFVDGRCSIYEHRPRTCRTYDCRVFPAAGLVPDTAQARIAEQTRRWRFAHPTPLDAEMHASVRAAAAFLRANADRWPDGVVPGNPTQLAVLAIGIHDVFLSRDGEAVATPDFEVVDAALRRARRSR
jgi:Fe-S-cluster containining protein